MQTTAFKQKPKYGKNVCVAACKKRKKKKHSISLQQSIKYTKNKNGTTERDVVFQDQEIWVYVCMCVRVCVVSCICWWDTKQPKPSAPSVWIVSSGLKWSSHTGLRQHNAAPNGAMQKYTETSHQHWSHRLFSKTNRQADRPKPWPPHLIQQVLIHWELKSVHGLHKSQRVRVYLCGRRVQAPGINNNNKVCSRKVHASCLQSLGCPKEGHVHPLICRCTAS